jgi:DNA-directed RNA polymerase specialized sigma24 family protein
MGLPEAQAGVTSGAGVDEGFEAFYVREYHAVVRLAYALSGSRLAAEDIAQEAFLRAFQDWEQIRHPSAWVRKVAVRRAGRIVHRRLLGARALARLLAGRGPAVAELPEEDAEVWRAIRALPRRQAQVIALRYVADAPVAGGPGVQPGQRDHGPRALPGDGCPQRRRRRLRVGLGRRGRHRLGAPPAAPLSPARPRGRPGTSPSR